MTSWGSPREKKPQPRALRQLAEPGLDQGPLILEASAPYVTHLIQAGNAAKVPTLGGRGMGSDLRLSNVKGLKSTNS